MSVGILGLGKKIIPENMIYHLCKINFFQSEHIDYLVVLSIRPSPQVDPVVHLVVIVKWVICFQGGKLAEKVKLVLEDTKLLAALSRCSDEDTSELESFHSALNKNVPKMHGFSLQGLISRFVLYHERFNQFVLWNCLLSSLFVLLKLYPNADTLSLQTSSEDGRQLLSARGL